ncbi:Hypothetical protein, putative [Bodo saltans]|uniref:Uncharacterized protein n=1 Tax=Bodo saltans TaxID=75058 RepID=A0A0S4J4M3_BODSA|nr:Hypothetical protein, putative [Bodo saltans]|eukprot:CUG86351.1 Hypothetical protein, putative [Bodo saltans]
MTIAAHVHQWREFLLTERTEWRIHPGCSKRGTPERRYAEFLLENMEAVFGAYVGGREWYFVVEWGVLVVSAAVLGAAEITAIDDAVREHHSHRRNGRDFTNSEH